MTDQDVAVACGDEGIVREAELFASRCHCGQTRKYTGRPYITHPVRVALRVAAHPIASDELVAAAYLHDVVEDCGVMFEEIEREFGAAVATMVRHLTNLPKVPGENRKLRKQKDRERIALVPPECKIVKLIDRIDNLREIDPNDGFAKVYADESLLLLEVLREADRELASEFQSLAEGLLN